MSQLNCSGARHRYNIQELRKTWPKLRLPEKSRGEGSFGLVHCLDGADRTGEKGLIGGGDVGIGGRATVGAEAGLVMSWVSCCSWAVRSVRVALIVCSKAFWRLVNSWRLVLQVAQGVGNGWGGVHRERHLFWSRVIRRLEFVNGGQLEGSCPLRISRALTMRSNSIVRATGAQDSRRFLS